ncbi:MAG: CvpA family protein [Helicobacteraceae bacterium]|jgi:membrane protein required for colicin V production|nr:CvpA family protein [Helicobacteraceae bacterium]
MHWIDIVVLVLIVALGVQGVFRGAIREVFSLVGVGLGVFLGSRLAFKVGSWASEHSFQLTNEGAIKLAGFAIIFILVWLVCFLLGLWLSKRIRAKESMSRALMVWFDRMLGFLLGAAKVFVLFSIIVYALIKSSRAAKRLPILSIA